MLQLQLCFVLLWKDHLTIFHILFCDIRQLLYELQKILEYPDKKNQAKSIFDDKTVIRFLINSQEKLNNEYWGEIFVWVERYLLLHFIFNQMLK